MNWTNRTSKWCASSKFQEVVDSSWDSQKLDSLYISGSILNLGSVGSCSSEHVLLAQFPY